MMGPVSGNLGTSEPSPAGLSASDLRPAVRARTPGWRDPRLWVGVAIVAVSVVAGARLVGAADESVPVWAVAEDMGAGDAVAADDLVAHRVRFVDPAHLELYYPASEALPADLQLVRGVDAGELLPRSAVGAASQSGTVQLPVAVDAALVPPSVQAGSVVDVYVTAGDGSGEAAEGGRGGALAARPVLEGVTVIDAPPLDEGFAATGKRQLVLGITDDQAAAFFRATGAVTTPVLTVLRRG
jgi:hypothetical protein